MEGLPGPKGLKGTSGRDGPPGIKGDLVSALFPHMPHACHTIVGASGHVARLSQTVDKYTMIQLYLNWLPTILPIGPCFESSAAEYIIDLAIPV